jgi:DNA-directed RNA polymerase sigma subunit (sigma70/sigma32)
MMDEEFENLLRSSGVDPITYAAEMSQEEIAKQLGLTRENVNYIQHKALKQLRIIIEQRGINKEDYL